MVKEGAYREETRGMLLLTCWIDLRCDDVVFAALCVGVKRVKDEDKIEVLSFRG